MFDSGTHLLGALLKANLGHEIMRDICPNGDIGAENTWKDDYHCYFWKHEAPQQLDRLLDTFRRQEAAAGTRRPLVVVALVRSPLAQLAGWAKAPYDLQDCVSTNGLYNTGTPQAFKPRAACQMRGDSFAGLTGVWNEYARAYDNLSNRVDDVVHTIVVEYERLVLNAEPVVRQIAEALGLHLDTFRTIEADAKKDGESHGRANAVRSIERMLYLQDFKPGQSLDAGGFGTKRAVCKSLDQGLLQRLSFVLSSGGNRTYMADCE